MKIAVVSATSHIAKFCIMRWAENGNNLFILIGRDASRLNATAADMKIRYPKSQFEVVTMDLENPVQIKSWFSSVESRDIDIALIAQGSLTNQFSVSMDLVYLKSQLELNSISVAMFLEGFVGSFTAANYGRIGVIGSVAGDRGRASNYVYGSSKALIETYVQGLQQRLSNSKVTVSLIKPGPTATPMTDSLNRGLADPKDVAKLIVSGIARKKRVIYTPRIWFFIMFVVRLIPNFIFNKLKF